MTGPVVLLHGGWLGGWAWDRLVPHLLNAGFETYAPTLVGLGDRANEGNADTDVSAQADDLGRFLTGIGPPVTLVGHSYSGAVVSVLADRMPDRITHLVVLDGFVPEDGDRLLDLVDPADAQATISAQQRNQGYWPPPDPATRWGIRDPDVLELLTDRLTPQPGGTSHERLRLVGAYKGRRTYVSMKDEQKDHFVRTAQRLDKDPAWRVVDYQGPHLDMLLEPELLARFLTSMLG